MVRDLTIEEALASHYTVEWDGKDDHGAVVSPGNYLLRLEVDGDSRTQTVQRILPVAY